jgi:hypothetical protein
MKKIEAKWTDEYPNLCQGKWIIKIDVEELSDIDNNILTRHMDTAGGGDYDEWCFDNSNVEV